MKWWMVHATVALGLGVATAFGQPVPGEGPMPVATPSTLPSGGPTLPSRLPELPRTETVSTWTPMNPPLNLEYLEAIAAKVNPVIERDMARIDAAVGTAVQAGLMPNPRFDTNNPQVINGRNTLLNAGFQQEIPVAGKKRLDQASANENTRQAEINFEQDRFALLAAVRQQFFVVLADQRRVQVLTEMTNLVRQSYETALKRKQAGEGTQIDVVLLQVDLERTEAALRSALAILQGDRKQLEALIGVPGLICGDVIGRLTGPYPEFDECKLIEFVTTYHSQIRYGESVIEQTRVQQRRAEVEPIPNPTLGPAYQYGLVPGGDQFWFNITFNIPVWDQNQGNIRAAKANVVAAHGSLDVTRLNLVNQAANLLGQYRASRAVVERYESGILTNTQEAIRLAREGYAKGGTVDLGTFLQTQRTAVQANIDYVDALQSLWSNATQLSGLLQLEHFP